MSMTGGLGLGAGSFSSGGRDRENPWAAIAGDAAQQWRSPSAQANRAQLAREEDRFTADGEYEQDAALFFGIDENPDLTAPSTLVSAPGQFAERATNSAGRTMLTEITNGARTEMDMLTRVIRLEMEDPDALMQLQMEMQLHGLLPKGEDEFVQFGVLDGLTKQALKNMAMAKASRPGMSWTGFFDRSKDYAEQELNLVLEDQRAAKAAELKDLAESLNQTLTLNLSSSDAIKENAQKLAVSLTGSEMDATALEGFVSNIHARERQNFWGSPQVQQAQAEMAQLNEEFLAAQGGNSNELKKFMSAIETIESNGNPNAINSYSGARGLYQFMPGTWAQETRRFGLDPSDWSPENQRRVAEATMARYYSMFGNWRDVAIAWYAGPASSHIGEAGSTNEQAGGHISIRGYADKAMQLMGTSTAQLAGNAAAGAAGLNPVAIAAGMGRSETDVLTDEVFAPTLSVQESEQFDVGSYLTNLVKEKGGVDVDAYRYLQTAMTFEDLLRGV